MSDTPIYDNMQDTPAPGPDNTPQPKVVAATIGAGVGAALATIIVWIINATTQADVPDGVELALGVVLTAGITFLSGYYKKN